MSMIPTLAIRTAPDEGSKGISLKVLSEATPSRASPIVDVCSRDDKVLKLVEVYNSVKGEGTQAGVPMTFVRFSKCNLACDFCDTPYDRVAIQMTEEELYRHIRAQDPAWVIFTGGEPCLQLKSALTSQLKSAGIKLAIETNGMVWTDAFFDLDYINISPKVAYDTPDNPIPADKMIAARLVQEVSKGNIKIDEIRYIICGPKDDIFALPIASKFITISPLMHDAEPQGVFKSGKGHASMYGIVNQAAMNRAMQLVQKYRHLNARLSVQVHKFVGVR